MMMMIVSRERYPVLKVPFAFMTYRSRYVNIDRVPIRMFYWESNRVLFTTRSAERILMDETAGWLMAGNNKNPGPTPVAPFGKERALHVKARVFPILHTGTVMTVITFLFLGNFRTPVEPTYGGM